MRGVDCRGFITPEIYAAIFKNIFLLYLFLSIDIRRCGGGAPDISGRIAISFDFLCVSSARKFCRP